MTGASMFRPGPGDGAGHPFHAGDLVRVGAEGRTVWKVTGFWLHGSTMLADLAKPGRPAVTSACSVDRLRRVQS